MTALKGVNAVKSGQEIGEDLAKGIIDGAKGIPIVGSVVAILDEIVNGAERAAELIADRRLAAPTKKTRKATKKAPAKKAAKKTSATKLGVTTTVKKAAAKKATKKAAAKKSGVGRASAEKAGVGV